MLHFGVVESLPVIPQEERQKLALETPDKHDRIMEDQAFAKTVEARQAQTVSSAKQDVKVVAWNIERGGQLRLQAELLAGLDADIVLLSEADYGMARSDQRHTAAELAAALGCGYVYGVEFLELGLGSLRESESCAGLTNDVGYHGNAILSRLELKRPALVRLEQTGAWFGEIKDGDQRRIGGRMACLATIEVGGVDVAFASVHLEDRATMAERGRLMEVLIDCIEEYAPQAPAVIGGDLNTFSFDREAMYGPLGDVRRAFAADPGRLLHPTEHEPLFVLAEGRGYDWQSCNLLGEPTQRLKSTPLSIRSGKKIDWFLTRGLKASAPRVIDATPRDIAWYLSDHELIAVNLSPG
ncbi:endonuclease [Candidatus Saccharibacteria bacterium]|nr:endonuclease [Candidatus Saccharibacteria bacterium]